jgi:tetratricopeptide (TPR) repeat protein
MLNFKEVMDYSPNNWNVFEELSKLCAAQMIVPYIGAGMSAFAKYVPIFKDRNLFPTWGDLINTQYENCFKIKRPESMDYIDAAEEIEKEFKKNGKDFYEKIRVIMGGDLDEQGEWSELLREAKTKAISIIPRLFFGPIVTTNFDQIIERVHNNELPVTFPYHAEQLKQTIDKRKRIIYKIHGCVSNAKDIVLTKGKYDEVYRLDSEYVKSLSAFCQGFHFLFLGCSLILNDKYGTRDYSIDLLEKLQKNSEMPHYAIIGCKVEELTARREELETRNIFPILYADGKHQSIKIILDELLNKIKSPNQIFKAPQYNTPFTDRTDSIINRINNRLQKSKCSILALSGNAGVGKTRIMSEYAYKIERETDRKVFWFNAISADSVREEIRQFAVTHNLISKEEKSHEIISKEFKYWMEGNDNYLLLLDNVEGCEDIKIFFDFNQTLTGTHHILMTTRLNEIILPNISVIQVNVFEKEDAQSFLQSHTGQESDQYADKIADTLGYLPLALEQAAAYIKESKESYNSYFEVLQKQPLDVLGKKHPESGAVPVRATWNITIQRIRDESAKELLWLCAFFASDNIVDYWFIKAYDILPQPLRNDVKENIKFNAIKTELEKYSLIKITNSDNGNYKKISMHRLLQDVVQKTIGKDTRWIDYCLGVIYNIVDWEKINDKNVANFFKLELPHAIKIAEKSYEIFNEDNEKLNNIAQIFFGLSIIYAKMLYLDSAESYSDKSIEIFERLYSKMANTANDQFTTYSKFVANNLFMAYSNRGLIYNDKIEYTKAIKDYDQCIAIGEQLRIENNLHRENELAIAYMNRGITNHYLELYDESLSDKNKSIEIYVCLRNAGLPVDENGLALVYMNRGATYEKIKRYNEALSDIDKCIEILEKLKRNGTAIEESRLVQAYTNRAVTKSKILMGKNEKRLSNEGAVIYNRNSSIALLNYRKKQKQ